MEHVAAEAFRRHYRQLYGFVRRRTRTDAEAEDVVADVFADAAARLERFEAGPTPVLAWLYTVARRRLVDEARRRSRVLVAVPAAADVQYGPSVARALRCALETLPYEQRRIVVLKLIEGRSFREIADVVGATEAACKMRLSRALERLRVALEQEGVEP